MFTKKFLKDAAERAVVTFAEVVLGFALAALAAGVGLTGVNWPFALNIAALATLVSVLKSVLATRVKESDSASLVNLKGTK